MTQTVNGHNRGVSRVSSYTGADITSAQARLRNRNIDPATVSVACALMHHTDCPGTVEGERRRGTPANPCKCPVADCGHGAKPKKPAGR